MYCKHCGKQVADDARFCPGCGKQISEKVLSPLYDDQPEVKKRKKHGCLTWLIVGILLFGGCAAIFGGSDTTTTSEPATQSTAAPTERPTTAPTEEPVVEISPADLYAAYEENEVAADNLYEGKKIRITGVIDGIGKDILDEVYITINAGDYDKIQCFFKNEKQIEKVASLKPGEEVTLVGKCSGLSILNVILRDCEIE